MTSIEKKFFQKTGGIYTFLPQKGTKKFCKRLYKVEPADEKLRR